MGALQNRYRVEVVRAVILAVGGAAASACATTTKQGDRVAGTNESRVEVSGGGISLPALFPTMPDRPLLDLGPVLSSSDTHASRDHRAVLLWEADALGADGFVYEGMALTDVYSLDLTRDSQWREENPGLSVLVDVTRYLLTGEIGMLNVRMDTARRAYYRAFRYVEDDPPALPLELLALAEELRPFFAGAKTLAEQLNTAHGLFAAGMLEVERYRGLRRRLILN